MPEVLFDDKMGLVILSCEYFHELTQAEVRKWNARAGDRALTWINIYCKANLTWAMTLVEVNVRKRVELVDYLHKALTIDKD